MLRPFYPPQRHKGVRNNSQAQGQTAKDSAHNLENRSRISFAYFRNIVRVSLGTSLARETLLGNLGSTLMARGSGSNTHHHVRPSRFSVGVHSCFSWGFLLDQSYKVILPAARSPDLHPTSDVVQGLQFVSKQVQ